MIVEICREKDTGKFTGYYYTFSMSAQTITPILAGFLMKHVSYDILFLYAAVFTALSFVTMYFVRHGDVAVKARTGLEAFEDL
jgi:MFS family permease